MQRLDVDRKQFFKFYNLPEKTITEEIRSSLESILCTSCYIDLKEIDGEQYENINQYIISYYCDQWWACGLNKLVKVGSKWYLDEIARGEGNNQIDALCSLLILCEDVIENEAREWMKQLFV